ncbi:MAG: type III PLP-dependent enzyme [Phascolarctobacterium sp.]|uniref:type III PLP-dependent enzyme n=1 Tax=Phascolarctobacterium sp. TaxID=2049039 RepID=UPI0026DAD60A|nr:type III PLP-dependent enzyme [Phascolarctobacterium sp.]MDO4921813.1 type III PLP-dependent enzyme [Phascolarctobacterium sp.]
MRRDKHFQLSREAVEKLASQYGTPLLVLSLEEVKKNYQVLKKYMPRVRIHYAIKANPHPEILRVMADMGSCFDVASDGEIRTLNAMGVEGGRMIYANPVKLGVGLEACRDCGVTKMTFDSASEIEKIKKQCPDATVLLRLRIDNSSAHVDLNKKFGAARENALALMLQAKQAGLDIAGVAFHVGSQTVSSDPYLHALDIARGLFDEAEAAGLHLRILDIGGGFPIPEPKVKFNLPEMLKQISARLNEDFPETEIWAEPGRYICGTAVNLITSVIGVTERGGQPWYFLDEGLYGTFSGVIFDQWDFKLLSFKEGDERVAATFAGPSCDSLDIMFRGRMTAPLEVGDLLLVPACGAYTSASATTFNGFSKARFVVWEEVKEEVMPVAAEILAPAV